MHKPSTIAKKLLKLFGPTGKHWTRNAYAKFRNGREAEPGDPKADKFCLQGGMQHLGFNNTLEFQNRIESEGYMSVEAFNDGHKWPTIKKVLTQIANGA